MLKNKVIVLAGGLGTRLGSIAADIPKPMVLLKEKPLLHYILKTARKSGLKDFIFKTQYLSEIIERHFGKGAGYFCNIEYFIEESPLGTAGGLTYLQLEKEPIIIIYGDVLLDLDLGKIMQCHKTKKADATLVVRESSHPEDSDVLVLDTNDRIIESIHKPGSNKYGNITNAALYILEPKCFALIPEHKKFDFGKDLVPLLIKNNEIFAYKLDQKNQYSPEMMLDVGTPDRLKMASNLIDKGFFSPKIECVFLDRDGTINKEVNLLHKKEQLELIPNASKAIKMLNNYDIKSFIITNQPVVARGMCTEQDVKDINKLLEEMIFEQSKGKVDAIYYCPHHPEKHHSDGNARYRVECNCRKPKIGMLIKAKEDFCLDLSKCFFIGDTTTDVQTGKNAKCKTILLETGYSGRDNKHICTPDYNAKDLLNAIEQIIIPMAKKESL